MNVQSISKGVQSIMHNVTHFTRTVFFLLTLVVAASSSRAAPRPNFLFIYTDDQRYDAFSAVQKEQGERGRFPWFQTPNMDRLASEGVRFRNAFVVCSLCAPSRAVSGRWMTRRRSFGT
jgi:hypothetical protein